MPLTTPPKSSRLLADWRRRPAPDWERVDGAEAQRIDRADGRAPMVKMSRMIPPTPVAAPWNGSTALG
jgi:hypothetical protein